MKLYSHQIQALEQTKDLNRVAYYLDMGLGKTFVGAEKMNRLGEHVNLLVCQKSKINDWFNHFKTIPNTDGFLMDDVFDLTNKKHMEMFLKMLDVTVSPTYMMVGVINYELLWRRKELIENLNQTQFTMMLDESSIIQNITAKQTSKGVLKLTPKNVILLSGTPVGGKYENLWTQIHLLGWNISEDVYNQTYVNWTKISVGSEIHKIVDKDEPYKNVDRLKRKLHEHGAVFMKTEECFDLPGQNFVKQFVDVPKEYNFFRKHGIVTIDGNELVGDTTLTKILYSRQICSQYNKHKIEAFRELLESTQDRLIVFYNFNAELVELQATCNDLERPYSMVNGKIKDLNAYENESNSVTLVQYQAGAKGLNLQKANKIIYFSLTLSSEDFEQSKKRIHRIGQEQPCFYYILLGKNTIEEQILETLEMRKDFTDELFTEYERKEQ